MKIEKVLQYYGTQMAAARALSVTQPTIANWVARGRIPALQQLRIERATGGKLRAEAGILPKISRA
jgi:DNA-binding transcriptional regulator YdaS (Cro superfamily)